MESVPTASLVTNPIPTASKAGTAGGNTGKIGNDDSNGNKPDQMGRIKGVVISKPIVCGSIAEYLPEKGPDGRTHKWTVFLKPYHNENMAAYVKKVHIKLHDSYANANRILFQMPYEVSETGWGEFEIVIKIFFQDPHERPVTVYHMLRLFHNGSDANDESKKHLPVISERYEEIVFQDPTVAMRACLTDDIKPYTDGEWKHHTDFEKLKKETLQKILAAKELVDKQIEDYKTKLQIAQETLSNFKDEFNQSKKAAPMTYLGGVRKRGRKRGRLPSNMNSD